jgi:RNA polymerase sigma factor (sigma-70 family)
MKRTLPLSLENSKDLNKSLTMKTLLQSIVDSPAEFESNNGEKALQQAVSKLPKDQQVILVLHFSQKISIKEIAKDLKLSTTTTYSKLNKALFTLKNELNPAAYERMYRILYPETGKPTFIQ